MIIIIFSTRPNQVFTGVLFGIRSVGCGFQCELRFFCWTYWKKMLSKMLKYHVDYTNNSDLYRRRRAVTIIIILFEIMLSSNDFSVIRRPTRYTSCTFGRDEFFSSCGSIKTHTCIAHTTSVYYYVILCTKYEYRKRIIYYTQYHQHVWLSTKILFSASAV